MNHELITIAHLITELNMGGAERMLHRLVTNMDRNRFRCLVISMTDTGPIGERIKAEGIPVFTLDMALGRPSLLGLARLFHLLKHESVDVIQTWLYHADLMGLIVGRIAGIKRIVWGIRCSNMHLRNYRPLTALTVRMGGMLSSLADAIIVNSEEGKEVHRRRGYHTGRMVLIPNGFNTERFHPDESARDWLLDQLNLSKDILLIGLVARFDPMKDQRTFLKAAVLLALEYDTVHFVMVGSGIDRDNRELISLMDENHIKEKVHMLGLRHDIPRVMAGLDIATSSSAFGEGFSNTIGEAMSCSIPCVVTDVGDSAQIVGDTGQVVPPRDPEAMARAWGRLLKMGRDGRRDLGERARSRIVGSYEIGRIVNRFEEFYQSLVESS